MLDVLVVTRTSPDNADKITESQNLKCLCNK